MANDLRDLDTMEVKTPAGKSAIAVAAPDVPLDVNVVSGDVTLNAGDISVSDITGTVNVEPGALPLHTIVDSGSTEIEPGTNPIDVTLDEPIGVTLDEPISVTLDEPIDVSIQDSTNLLISVHMASEVASGTLANEALVNTSQVTLNPGHGFIDGVAGQLFIIPGYYLGEVEHVSSNVLTLDIPLNYTFPAGTTITRGTEYINVDGSSVPVLFGIKAIAGRKFDIEGFHITFISSSPMDDSLFASLTELTNGMMCRVKKSATQYNNIFNVKSNKDMKLYGDVEYSTKAPSGKYGMTFSMRFKEHYGVVIRLDGDLGQQLELWIRDNLGTLAESESIVHGHVVED